MSKQKAKRDPVDIGQMEQDYSELISTLGDYATDLANQLDKLLGAADVTLGFPIQHRVKTWTSLSEKLERLLGFVSFEGIQDLIGIRIILLFKRDVDTVCKILENHFSVVRHYDTQNRLREDQFGYISKHYVIELKKEWLSSFDASKMKGLVAEIQIRTVAQHIWSEVSHKLQYKQEDAIPPSVRRSIYRVSALLETVDLEFERVLEQRLLYRANIAAANEENEQLNVDLMEKILDSLLPADNKAPFENYDLLLSRCKLLGITTGNDLLQLLEKHQKLILELDAQKAQDVLADTAKDHGTRSSHLSKYQLDRAAKNVFLSHTGILREALIREFGDNAKKHFPE